MSDNIVIRYAKLSDVDAIVQFNLEMAYETEGISLSVEKLTDGVKAVFDDNTKGFYVIAESDNKPVGQALVTYEWSDWRNAIFWWIQSVYVLPEYRGAGIFKAIFTYIRLTAESSNVCGIRLYVERNNHIAKSVYKRLGMEESHYDLYELMLK
ncbi:TPA: GNAT family N-acetyltransferase [Candidatus Poribacteria bacterium]|nr:GNAT family N-acetyltransferase [Candidatus Poribacteria bacterium]